MNFEEVLTQYKNNIVRVCKMFSQNSDERKDLFQEISIQIYKSLMSYRAEASLNTFIYRISINTCVRYKYKHQLGERKISLDDVEWYKEDDSMLQLEQQEKLEQLYRCIYKLNDVDKSIVLLYLEDLNHKEIAEISGITENHVAVKMSRIKEKLFKCLTINPL
jgi:RNA polymerase sigma factor (sigma-70 family)